MRDKKFLAVFDMDGTLFDTRKTNFFAYHDAIKEVVGNSVEYDIFNSLSNGQNYKNFLPKIVEKISNDEINEIHNLKKLYYKKHIKCAIKNDHLFRIISSIKDSYIITLATTASKKNTIEILNHFKVIDLFEIVVAQEDVVNLKPDPECFINIMHETNIEPINTLIFEDSVVGMEAARLSKASVVNIDIFNV
jgi:beta-phosphoglucomutase